MAYRTAEPHVVHAAREGDKFNHDTELHVERCPACHILFAIPESLYLAAKRWPGNEPRGWNLSCPLGHTWHYTGTSDKQRLAEEQDRSARLLAQLDQSQAHARAMKGVATRRKNELDRVNKRVVAGVCPCCHRTFKQLARHMKAKHPGFAEQT